MKSAYEEEEFAAFWDQISGSRGQSYKKFVIDPAMLKQVGSLKNKTVIDLGCGNGYMGPLFIRRGAKNVILMDISRPNIEIAKKRNKNEKVKFIRQDCTKKWRIEDNSTDIIYSDMMLNEIQNIKRPMAEAARVLKRKGKFVFAITHPAWDLYEYTKKKFTGKSEVIPGAAQYFFRGYNYFVMSTESLKPPEGHEYKKSYKVEHYQRPLEDYINTAIKAGFDITKVIEPKLNSKILSVNPGYKEMVDHPIGIIIATEKK